VRDFWHPTGMTGGVHLASEISLFGRDSGRDSDAFPPGLGRALALGCDLGDPGDRSPGPDDVLDGACTLIFMFMKRLRMTYENHDEDVIACVVPNLVATMRVMPKSVRPEAIPTMAGLLVAAGTGLSPNLWRKRYGYWSKDEMTPLEATAFLLAEHINRLTDDPTSPPA
jgi:hypothetical protein